MALSRRTFLTTAMAGGAAAAVTAHQTGVTHPGNEYGLMAAFTVTADKRDDLADSFRAITSETKRIMEGERYDERDPSFPAVRRSHRALRYCSRCSSGPARRLAPRAGGRMRGWLAR